MRGQDLASLLAYTHGGMERERRFLKDQSYSATADLAKVLGVNLEKIMALEEYGALFDVAVRGQ